MSARVRSTLLLFALATSVFACSGGGDDDDDSTPTPTPTATLTPTPTPTPAACTAAASDLVYVIDETGQLRSFDPTLVGISDPFQTIGAPACTPAAALAPFTDPATPLSMTIDRGGDAQVLYTSGEIFLVSTSDGSCSNTGFVPEQVSGAATWSLFGMAFTTDSAGLAPERMFLSGGDTDGSLGSLGQIAPAGLAVTTVAAIGGAATTRPDLMGLSDSTLWGFFPDMGAGFVQQIDKTSGSLLGSPAPITVGGSDTLTAWAAAQWGGTFWLFVTTTDGITSNSTIRTIARSNGAYALVLQNLTFSPVAAGSSTCAPITP